MDEQKPTEHVNYVEICRAWRAWCECCNFDVREFVQFTGWDLNYNTYVTPEQARRIRLLAGPHGHTLLKAYLASKEY